MAPLRDWPSECAGAKVVAAVPTPFELLAAAAAPTPFELLAVAATPAAPSDPCNDAEYRLARLSALAARAGTASSSRASTSPRCRRNQRQGSCSPSLRVVQEGVLNVQEGGQRSKKRKSPCAIMPPFPLSRMVLSPRIRLSGSCLRSPSMRHETSPSALTFITPLAEGQRMAGEIDLNVALEDSGDDLVSQENGNGDDTVGQENGTGDDTLGQENGTGDDTVGQENGTGDDPIGQDIGTGDDPLGQGNAHNNLLVPDEKRRAIFEALLGRAKNGHLKAGETKEVSIQFSVPIRTVQRIWKQGKNCLDQGLGVDVSTKKNRCGRKKKVVDVSKLQDIPLSSRTTIDDVAKHLGVSKAKVQRMKKEGLIKRVSNTIKPYLTDNNKKDHLRWCLRMLDLRSVPNDPVFRGLFDYVFIDEKWFYITRKTLRYYTVSGEEQPRRTCKNKNYIPKIQILTVLARPRFDSNGNCTFDGKIGCFPFVTYEPAKRSSVNRPAGTIEMKPINSIKKETIRQFMIEKVLPAIREKWPREDADKPIYIQQDNAKPHLSPNDRQFCEAARQDGFDMRLVCQPANSPDFNILDLWFFNSIQSIQYKTSAKTTEELVATVNLAFENYSVGQSNRIFLTLHGCMKEVMKIGGGNGYDIPHIRKGMLERQGCLPLQLKCEASLVDAAMAQIDE